ncbi:hypothetical protein EDB89DRAFT_2175741 [Lactarius sanguifluus]|nr:hypothetical protein EDB89DRAFT_2175741 [Lactarius sanguifluus]
MSVRIARLALDRYWATTCNALSMAYLCKPPCCGRRGVVSRSVGASSSKSEPGSSRLSGPGLPPMAIARDIARVERVSVSHVRAPSLCRGACDGRIGSHDFEHMLDSEFALRWGGGVGQSCNASCRRARCLIVTVVVVTVVSPVLADYCRWVLVGKQGKDGGSRSSRRHADNSTGSGLLAAGTQRWTKRRTCIGAWVNSDRREGPNVCELTLEPGLELDAVGMIGKTPKEVKNQPVDLTGWE